MDNSIKRIISSRLQSKSDYGDDLLGIMLKAHKTKGQKRKMSIEEIIHECRTFFFAGHETTSNLLTWTTMLLSLHQDWQEKLREEIFKECGKEKIPDSETFSKLKLVMFIFHRVSCESEIIMLLVVEETCLCLADEHGDHGVTSTLRTSVSFVPRSINKYKDRPPRDSQGHNRNHPDSEDA